MRFKYILHTSFISRSIFCVIILLFFTGYLMGHGGLHERILETTQEISEHPDSAFLYLKRGKIYLNHEAYDSSLVDLRRCERMGYSDVRLDLSLIQTLHHLGHNQEALTYTQKVLYDDPVNVKAIKLQGKVYSSLAQYQKAAASYEDVIKLTVKTFPFNYIDASTAWEQVGTYASRQKAVHIIKEGISQLGPIVSLYERMVYIGTTYKDYDLAIASQTEILHKMSRKEYAFYNRGLLYQKMGREDLAKEDFLAAMELIRSLPRNHRSKPAIKKLKTSLKLLLE